ncbi:MAG: hypothetical protein JW982_16890 [Spirochaetes bacterium]|nr:hypothetical protein [Spirochaetota bacterium]
MKFSKINLIGYILILVMLPLLYYTSRINFLLFHSISEMFGIIVSCCIFIIAWVTRKKSGNKYFVLLGIAYLSVGIIDFFHTLSYSGMNLFDSRIFYANQLWIGARFLESGSLLLFVIFFNRKLRLHYAVIFYSYMLVTCAVLLSVLYFRILPVCFVAGQGQTEFKIISEYIIVAVLVLCIIVLSGKKSYIEPKIFYFMTASFIFTIVSEFSFTLYSDNFGIINFFGHIFKIISFYFIYKSVIEMSLEAPFSLVFSELNRRIQEISELNMDLEISNKTKNKFFAIISHDLKNPVNGLNGLLNVVSRDWERFPENEKKFYVDQLFLSSEKLLNLLNNLLLWSRNQMDKLEIKMELFSINQIIINNISLVSQDAVNKKIEIKNEINEDITVKADRNMTDVVIRNIITNAVKFTDTNGLITISAKHEKNFAVIDIADNGIGIPLQYMNKLFGIDSSIHRKGTDEEEGTGLGLILCKDFMEKNEGDIRVVSEEGKGSVFSIMFPAG